MFSLWPSESRLAHQTVSFVPKEPHNAELQSNFTQLSYVHHFAIPFIICRTRILSAKLALALYDGKSFIKKANPLVIKRKL